MSLYKRPDSKFWWMKFYFDKPEAIIIKRLETDVDSWFIIYGITELRFYGME